MKLFKPSYVAYAHCDLPCGVYDPAQARIEAESVLNAAKKYQESDDPSFKQRCVTIKEERAEEVKHHLWVLWTDYFKPEHLEKYPDLHEVFWNANKLAGANKQTVSSDSAKKLVESVDEIATIFWATKGVDYNDPVADIRFGS